MSRAGMANLITTARNMAGGPGTADVTDGVGVNWWSDDQIEEILDDYSARHRRVELVPVPEYSAGDTVYTEYQIPPPLKWFEEDDASSDWDVKDSDGNAAPSHTVNYRAGYITFAADTAGSAYYLDCDTFDMYRAVAEIWKRRAGLLRMRSIGKRTTIRKARRNCVAIT